jgi:Ca2+-binding RTX toxin-like protein
VLKGGAGDDRLNGGRGVDVVRGGAGNDVINVADVGSGDRAIGGAGTDRCIVDALDVVRGCDTVTFLP